MQDLVLTDIQILGDSTSEIEPKTLGLIPRFLEYDDPFAFWGDMPDEFFLPKSFLPRKKQRV